MWRRVGVAVAVALAAPAQAQVVLKLGTLAPRGSAWHETLQEMALGFEQASEGRVRLRIYPGGTQGDEAEMIRKLGIGQLQGAALTNVGMHDLTTEPKGLSLPLFFEDEAEAECTFAAVRPALEAALAARGYAVLHWSRLGALQLYCTTPRRTPAEMADARLWVQAGDDAAARAWRVAGFRPVTLSTSDLYPGVVTGMIDCVPTLSVYALSTRLFERARYLMDLTWGRLYGATIVRREAWERIEPELRARLLAIAARSGAAVEVEARRMNTDAIAAMRRQGLQVVAVEPGPWHAAMRRGHAVVRGTVVPAPFFDALAAARDGCRAHAAVLGPAALSAAAPAAAP